MLTVNMEVKRYFCNTWNLVENTSFQERKSNLSGENFFLAYSFRNYRVGQTSENSLERSAKHFDTFCASYNVTSVGPQMSLETNISKKGQLPGEKRFWPTFSRFVEFYRPWGTNYKGTQGILTYTVEVIRSFLLHIIGCWKRKFLKKRQSFQWKN